MPSRSIRRDAIAFLASASIVVAPAGCSSSRGTSRPPPVVSSELPKKEYQWKDMSTGRSFFRPITPPAP